jgi:pyridoxine kinase
LKSIHLSTSKKIALVNDISGYGRCSATVALPIISWLGVQCCPVPTAVLSNHTGYESCYFDDYTCHMEEYLAEWKKLGLHFDGIETGFLGSVRQIQIVRDMITSFADSRTAVLVDPVMGDHGQIYRTYTEEMCREMRSLVALADIVTPNLTEACRLTDTVYRESFSRRELTAMARAISALGPSHVVITGIPQGGFIANFVYDKSGETHNLRTHRIAGQRSGTGDIFAAILAADAVNGVSFDTSVHRAGTFIRKCAERTLMHDDDPRNGVCLEEMMPELKRTV